MIETIKVQLRPSNKQLTKLFQYAGCSLCLLSRTILENENYKQGNKFLQDGGITKKNLHSWRNKMIIRVK